MKKRYVYSVRRARANLLAAIRAEVYAGGRGFHGAVEWVPPSVVISRREQAVRDLIASVRHEERSK